MEEQVAGWRVVGAASFAFSPAKDAVFLFEIDAALRSGNQGKNRTHKTFQDAQVRAEAGPPAGPLQIRQG